jgi:hypothetical protein
MGVTNASFRARFEELSSASDTLIDAVLAEALTSIDADAWGDKADQGQMYLAAHLIAMSPFGVQAGLRAGQGANQTSAYWGTYEDLRRRVGAAHRAVLG